MSAQGKAIFLQIADRVMDAAVAGTYRPGERIPSVRELAATLEVNANTVMRSYEWLERHGLIYNRRGIGFFMADDAKKRILDLRRSEFLNEEAPRLFSRLSALGISPDELADLYRAYDNKDYIVIRI